MTKPLKNFLTPILGFIFVVGGAYLLSWIR
jgi:hypothetical protein